jgi:hypothetical protein
MAQVAQVIPVIGRLALVVFSDAGSLGASVNFSPLGEEQLLLGYYI